VEPDRSFAPPVVSVVVVHDPGSWFDEAVSALASQDYPNLRLLFVLAAAPEAVLSDVEQRITAAAPDSLVYRANGNPGFGPLANDVLQLVEGENGFFLLCHDDIAPDRDVVRLLVEELYRSNAGIVGPKLVEWDRPALLQHVGLGLDRFGEIDPITEPDEVDQEQHDAVGDVFVVPSACLLVRADLFRSLGGFDPAVSFHGDDVDLCWRAHLSGARVVVVPGARVRHREDLAVRRPDLDHRTLRARHRMRAVATLTGAARLPLRTVELVALTIVEMVVGLFTGRFGEAWSSLRALIGMIPRTPSLIARRTRIADTRLVPEQEVIDLQVRGSARLTSYLRMRDTMTYIGPDSTVRRWRENSAATATAWIVVVTALIVGSRTLFSSGVPVVGEFLPFPASARDLWDGFASGFNAGGLGGTEPNPTGFALISVLSVGTFFQMGLANTIAVVGLVFAGIVGAGRVGSVFPSTRARIACYVVYGALPLAPAMLAEGRWSALVAYAAVPWFVHLLRCAAGIASADPRSAEYDPIDGVMPLDWRQRARYIALAALVAGGAGAFAPVVVVLLAAVGIVIAVATLLALGSWRTSLWLVGATLVASALAVALNLPWSLSWSWDAMTPVPAAAPSGRGLLDVASLGLGVPTFALLALVLYLPLLAALVLARGWRLTWAVRAAALVAVFGTLAVLSDHGTIDAAMPEVGVLLVPVALGLAVGAAAALAAFDLDVRGSGFGWRQPAGVLAGVAVAIGVVPGVLSIGDGSWSMEETPIAGVLADQMAPSAQEGDGRVLLIGDPLVLPVPSHEIDDGVAYAVVSEGALDVRDRWVTIEGPGDARVREVVAMMAAGETVRAGRLLGVLGITDVVVPRVDGTYSTNAEPLPVPAGLIESLEDQLDLALTFSPPSVEIFENRAALPVASVLSGEAARAVDLTTAGQLVRAELDEFAPGFVGVLDDRQASDDISAGVVHLAVPFDEHWSLSVDGGESSAPRQAFGITTAFGAGSAGTARLAYETSGSRVAWLVAVGAIWVLVLIAASRTPTPFSRRHEAADDLTLLDLDEGGSALALDDVLALDDPGGWIGEVLDAGEETGPHDGRI